jgi:hypothetical protein
MVSHDYGSLPLIRGRVKGKGEETKKAVARSISLSNETVTI